MDRGRCSSLLMNVQTRYWPHYQMTRSIISIMLMQTPGLAAVHGAHSYQDNRIIYGSAPKWPSPWMLLMKKIMSKMISLFFGPLSLTLADVTMSAIFVFMISELKCVFIFDFRNERSNLLIDEMKMPVEHEIEILI